MKISHERLPDIWQEVQEERANNEMARWRKLEALCGYDPEQGPEDLIKPLYFDESALGIDALEEVAAAGRHACADVLSPILEFAATEKVPRDAGFTARMPHLNTTPAFEPLDQAWQRGAKLAKAARSEWGFGNGPIGNNELAELFQVCSSVFTSRETIDSTMPFALRRGTGDACNLYFTSKWFTSRRFAACRLLGDHLLNAADDRLIPATRMRTSRQKVQRSFAQEFLCPFDALQEKIQTEYPNTDDIEETADYFSVSPLMVKTTLVNKGELERAVLD